ncbi:Gfo/Idh/MocA family oxidoreductase [Solidesulfovibrio sp.]|uniref:Gfo/Idh/MocA family oxidoreductase n=1 Tax=Solidesulfovibrio sp. TaxID=2910990 RepID=UPI0026127FF8|nr:Gfo/Idh/MocA family oxidoreductase [Solidesulfovibrio sp.]
MTDITEKPANPLGVAVVGAGYWGKNLVRNFHNLGALRHICDPSRPLLDGYAATLPDVPRTTELAVVLADPSVAGLAVATPAETHYAIAKAALSAGKHVLVEKPMTLVEAEARELIALAESRGLTLMVGHLLQYHPHFLALKEMAAAGELGRIDYIYSHRLNLGKIRREENILWSFAPHDISMILTLAGGEPSAVQTTGGYYLHHAIADVTTTHMDFASGMKAHIFVSWLHPFKEQKLVVVGERKMAVFDDTLPWADKLQLYPHAIRWENQMPVPVKAEAQRVDIPQGEPLRLECQHFLDCMASGRPARTDGHEGLRVLRVLNASQKSLENGSLPVPLTEDAPAGNAPDHFVHPTALVDAGASVGAGTKIWHFSHVLKGSKVGRKCNVGQNVVVGPDVSVGDGCKIQNNVSVYQGVTLEDDVFCGPSIVFTNIFNPRAHIPRMHEVRQTLVRKGATLGANCTIVCGHVIGRYAFVGAGSVVTRDVPDHALVVGNPARRIGWMCACGEKLGASLRCPACDAAYVEGEEGLRPA